MLSRPIVYQVSTQLSRSDTNTSKPTPQLYHLSLNLRKDTLNHQACLLNNQIDLLLGDIIRRRQENVIAARAVHRA